MSIHLICHSPPCCSIIKIKNHLSELSVQTIYNSLPLASKVGKLQSRTKLLEKVFPIVSTFLRNKTLSKTTPLRKKKNLHKFNVASHKHPGIRLSFEYTTTLLSGEGREGRTSTASMFRKMLSKYTIFSTVLSKIVPSHAAKLQSQTKVVGKVVQLNSSSFQCSKRLFSLLLLPPIHPHSMLGPQRSTNIRVLFNIGLGVGGETKTKGGQK